MSLVSASSLAAMLMCALSVSKASAQSPSGFPADLPTPAAADITKFVTDKTFSGQRADGATGQFNYRADGKFDVMYSRGSKEYGTWTTKDGELCVSDPLNGAACNQVRIQDEKLLYRRNRNGEIITLSPK